MSFEAQRSLGRAPMRDCFGNQVTHSPLECQPQHGVLVDHQAARHLVWLGFDDATEASS